MNRIPELKEKFFSQCGNAELAQYVWETTMEPQLGYSFSTLHSLAYSFVGIQTLILATNFPSIYWNCACLITNSGGNEDAEDEEEEKIIDEEVEEEDTDTKKKKQRNTNYGKISTAIGQMMNAGIQVSPPDINKSSFTFVPDAENNRIIYGIKGITRIGADVIAEIMANRPFTGLSDFLSKVKVNKPQMVNLIKSGAFDCFGEREDIMYEYIDSISDKKQRLTLQNMAMLIKYDLLPEELSFEVKVYNFNKYIKKCKADEFNAYYLDQIADKFFCEHYDEDLTWYEEVSCGRPMKVISQTQWDAIYKKQMDTVRDYLKQNKDELLAALNKKIFLENWDKYCSGSISKWEMDSIGFYYHEHELARADEAVYKICDFNKLPTDPEIDRIVFINGKEIPMFKLHCLAGTVIDKNKNKNSITLLTKYGVVNVKIYQAQYAKFDKQISEKNPDGTKTVKEKSWFTRGTKLLVTGIRRDDTFQLKKYKNTPGEVVQLITGIDEEDGLLSLQAKRYGE